MKFQFPSSRTLRSWLLPLCALGLLSACSFFDDKPADSDKPPTDDNASGAYDGTEKHESPRKQQFTELQPICPQVAIVRDLAEARDYGGEVPDSAQLVSSAKLLNVSGDCTYDKDTIDISFTLDMLALKGPRLGGDQTSFSYFTAVMKPDGSILTKNIQTETFHFSSSEHTDQKEEKLHVVIPLSSKMRLAGPDYRVFIGFQLSDNQLEEIRREKYVK